MSLLVSSPFARDLARLLASWVAFIVFVQAMALAIGLGQGPRHLHLRADTDRATFFVHAAERAAAAQHVHAAERRADHHADHHAHGGWARHVHTVPAADDPMLVDDAQDLGAAAGVVLSSMVGVGPSCALLRTSEAGHVMRASRAWSCITHAASLPERPPRG